MVIDLAGQPITPATRFCEILVFDDAKLLEQNIKKIIDNISFVIIS